MQPGDSPDVTVRQSASSAAQRVQQQTLSIVLREEEVAQALAAGRDPAHYELMEKIGEGGMGEVFLARQTSVDRVIALKLIKPGPAEDESERSKFLAEAVATADLEHPNIVPVYGLASTRGGRLFYAMKRVQGTPWSEVIRERPLMENLRILMRVADGVAYAHSKGIIHRDIKPENVMLGEYGEIVVMDWGLAVSVSSRGRAPALDGGVTEGTPSYMAPEMARGDAARIGTASDIYLLGAILFEIVTGEAPHHAGTVREALAMAAENRMVPTRRQGELLNIALKAMASAPADRHASVQEFQAAVTEYQSHHESVILMEQARRDLQAGIKRRSYELFTQAIYGFRQARRLWRQNHAIKEELDRARLEYARCAFRNGDFDLAVSQLDDTLELHRGLRQRVSEARTSRVHRQRVIERTRQVALGLAFGLLAMIVVAYLWVQRESERALRAESDRYAAEARQLLAEKRQRALAEQVQIEQHREWRTVFRDDFSDRSVEVRWQIEGAESYGVHRQQLRVKAGDPALVILKNPVGGDVRVQYLCHLESSFLSDITTVLNGYQLKFGGWGNTRNALVAPDGTVLWDEEASPLERGRTYRVSAEKVGSRFRLSVDGRLVFDHADEGLLERSKTDRMASEVSKIALMSYQTDAWYDNVTVAVYGAPIKADLLETAERHFSRGNYQTARDLFQDVVESATDPERLQRAEYGLRSAEFRLAWAALDAKYREQYAGPIPFDLRRYGKELILRGEQVKDLSGLEGQEINQLKLWRTAVTNLVPLADMPLDFLSVDQQPVPLGDIRKITGLRFLSLAMCGLTRLDPLEGLGLDQLWLSHNAVEDLRPLASMPLTRLGFNDNRVSDLRPISRLRLSLLNCERNRITSIEPLKDMPLVHLDCAFNRIRDIRALEGKKLAYLDISSNQVKDLSPLAKIRLDQLDCANNLIADLGPVIRNPLVSVNVDFNAVEDLKGINTRRLRRVFGAGNRLISLDALQGSVLEVLCVESNRLETLEPLVNAPPTVFYFEGNPLSTGVVAAARDYWADRDATRHHAVYADFVLARQAGGWAGVRKLAQTWNGHDYLVVPVRSTWEEAVEAARESGGHLVTITSPEEDLRVAEMLADSRMDVLGLGCWMGLTHGAGEPAWVTGEALDYVNHAADFTLTRYEGCRGELLPSVGDNGPVVQWSWSHPSYDATRRPFVIEWKDAE